MPDFNKRWNINNDSSYEEDFQKLKTRVNNILTRTGIDGLIGEEGVMDFCNELNLSIFWNSSFDGDYLSMIRDYFKNVSNIFGLAQGLELLTTIRKEYYNIVEINKIIKDIYDSAILKSEIISGT